MDDVDIINSVLAYNRTKKRFQYDCKLYEIDGKWYWYNTNKYCRDFDEDELEMMSEYFALNKERDR